MSLVRLPVLPVASIVLTLLMLSASNAQAQSTDLYTLNRPASTVGFTIYASKIFKIRRDGQFKDFTAQLAYDPARPANTHVDLTVFTASVDMQNTDHNQLLKSGTFFDVDHYPTMHFSSSSTVIKPDGTFSMTGDMTIRGITRRMTIPVRLRQDSQVSSTSGAVFETTFHIDRTEFGLNGMPNWNGFKVSISKNVQIHIAIATSLNGPQLAH
jgi:polyisoprenoid-binding protein YceI